MAASAGPSTQLAAACRTSAPSTTANTGQAASINALKLIAPIAQAASVRSDRAASTRAPPGIWPTKATSPLIVSTKPISTCGHACAVR